MRLYGTCLAGVTLTNHAIDCAKEHRALRGGGRLAQVLHNQRAVAEDIDEFAQVEETDLLKVLSLLISGGGAERQCDRLTNQTSCPHGNQCATDTTC